MYSTRTGLTLGFHGCDRSVALKVINQEIDLNASENDYDWLGHGIYFWDSSPDRAYEYATYLRDNPSKAKNPIKDPAVVGAVINLGFCFDLLDYGMLQLLKAGYDVFVDIIKRANLIIPENLKADCSEDLRLRKLDCAVIETIHKLQSDSGSIPYDSVRGVFWEGSELYPGAGFKEKDHIQICVRNTNCIKGFFLPRLINAKDRKI